MKPIPKPLLEFCYSYMDDRSSKDFGTPSLYFFSYIHTYINIFLELIGCAWIDKLIIYDKFILESLFNQRNTSHAAVRRKMFSDMHSV